MPRAEAYSPRTAGSVGGVEWAVALRAALGSAEGEGEEVVDVEGEGRVGGAELDEVGGGGFDGAADLCVEDGGELGEVDVGAFVGGVVSFCVCVLP